MTPIAGELDSYRKLSDEGKMSTIPTGATNQSLLGTLNSIGGYVTLATEVGEVVVPLVKGLITDIKGLGTTTITFTLDVSQTMNELAAIATVATADEAQINSELIRLGKPTIPVTPPTP